MRRIGTLSDESQAKRFSDYLVTLSIDSSVESVEADGKRAWDIWIRDELDVEQAKEAFGRFQESPDAESFRVEAKASQIRHRRDAENERRLKTQKSLVRSMPSRGALAGQLPSSSIRQQRIPVTIGIIIASVLACLATNFSNPRPSRTPDQLSESQRVYVELSFVDPIEYHKSGDPMEAIKRGELWRLVTPMFLHGDAFHLAFNMYWIFIWGSIIERLHGSLFFALLIFGTHIAGILLQASLTGAEFLPAALQGSPLAVGASGGVYGLFGFLWIRPNLDPSYPFRLSQITIVILLGWLVFCIVGPNMQIANNAHIGGLVAGVLVAALSQQFRAK